MATSTPQRKCYSYHVKTEFSSGAVTKDRTDDVVTWTDERTPESQNPRYKSQIKLHINAATPMGAQRLTNDRGNVMAHYDYGPVEPYNRVTLSGSPLGITIPLSTSIPGAATVDTFRKLASLKLMLRAQQARQSLQALVSLGEVGETLRMLRRPARALFEGIFDYLGESRRRARKAKKKHRKRVVQDTWLEYNFGWAPLVSDIEGAHNALHNLPLSQYQYVRATHSDDVEADTNLGSSTVGKFVFGWEETVKYNVSVRAYGEVGVECISNSGKLARWGIETEQFVPTLWELIPYSFVADYFSNIGDIISANALPRGAMKWHGMTSKVTVSKRRSYRFSSNGTKNNVTQYKGGGGFATPSYSSRTHYSRQTAAFTSFGLSDFAFEIPGLSRKWLNLAALAKAAKGGARI